MWQAVADIRFEPAADPAGADILIGAQAVPRDRAYTNVAHAPAAAPAAALRGAAEPVRRIGRSLICLNPRQRWKIGFDGNLKVYDLRYTLAHEIGHAIGLDHPGSRGELMGFRYTERFRALQHGDIAGAVALYGPAPSLRAAGRTRTIR
jgi:hypothetical protein